MIFSSQPTNSCFTGLGCRLHSSRHQMPNRWGAAAERREREACNGLAGLVLVPASTGVGHGHGSAIQPYFVCQVFPHAATSTTSSLSLYPWPWGWEVPSFCNCSYQEHYLTCHLTLICMVKAPSFIILEIRKRKARSYAGENCYNGTSKKSFR